MRLADLLADVEVDRITGPLDVEVREVVLDSRRAGPGTLFAAAPGAHHDGHDHADEAVARGAVAVLCERPLDVPVTRVEVGSVRRAVGPIAAAAQGHPSAALTVLGVTGTNGKTTVTHLLEAIAGAAGRRVGVVGTLGARVGTDAVPVGFTTPEAPDLQALLATMRDRRVDTVAMEVSSHALTLHRVDGTRFAAACFTNLTHDHLDFHGSMEAYLAAKARLFTPAFTGHAAVNVDDPHGPALVDRARRDGLEVATFGLGPEAEVSARAVEPGPEGTRLTLTLRATGEEYPARLALLGRINVANALAAAATALTVGFEPATVIDGLAAAATVPGRLERVDAGQAFTLLVDYAHTPDALAAVLGDARRIAAGGRVIAVFGCGGDRDRAKRPLMGAAAGAQADLVVLTTDNSRSEDPAAIADEVERGLRDGAARYEVVLDRRAAIARAVELAGPGDVVVVAGKGHESGQTAGDATTPFDDRVVAREVLEGAACA
ncbi:MAG: UDP-N-acetylmuramoyl-L-alanyl-D-glutamate--2,6-diaminopimelate ligase [Actinomycetes bacterium]